MRQIIFVFNFKLVCYFIISLNKIYFTTKNVQIPQRHHANRRQTFSKIPHIHGIFVRVPPIQAFQGEASVVLSTQKYPFIANVHDVAADHAYFLVTFTKNPIRSYSSKPIRSRTPLGSTCAISPKDSFKNCTLGQSKLFYFSRSSTC